MYNLLVTAREGTWDEKCYEFDRSRFLEYTTESIATIFQSLTPDLIETLKGYPCLFAYEGDTNDLRIGKLNSIKERGRKIFIEFELNENIPPIPFKKIKPLATLLDFRNWEMNRTHWAVKDEDLFLRLADASIINSKHIREPEKSVKRFAKKTNDPKVKTVQGFIGKVLATERSIGTEVFYRGHSNKSKYKLEPSLFRKDSEGNP